MNVSCDIIRDLLPLYAEDMVSQASKELVDGHLCGCDECVKELGKLKKAEKVPVEVDVQSIAKLKKSIRNRRILAVITALMVITTILMSVTLFLSAPIYLSTSEAIRYVEQLEDGGIRIYYSYLANGIGQCAYGDAGGNWGLIAWTYMGDYLFPSQRLVKELKRASENGRTLEDGKYHTYSTLGYGEEMADYNYWYVRAKDGMAEKLLWEGKYAEPFGPLIEVNYHLAYYCGGLAVIAAAMAGLAFALRKKRAGKYILYGAVFVGCVSAATVISCAGQFMELWGEFTENFQKGWILAVPMYATCLCVMKLHGLNKQDKGL